MSREHLVCTQQHAKRQTRQRSFLMHRPEAHHVGGQGRVGHVHVGRQNGHKVCHHDPDAQCQQVHQPEHQKVSFKLHTNGTISETVSNWNADTECMPWWCKTEQTYNKSQSETTPALRGMQLSAPRGGGRIGPLRQLQPQQHQQQGGHFRSTYNVLGTKAINCSKVSELSKPETSLGVRGARDQSLRCVHEVIDQAGRTCMRYHSARANNREAITVRKSSSKTLARR